MAHSALCLMPVPQPSSTGASLARRLAIFGELVTLSVAHAMWSEPFYGATIDTVDSFGRFGIERHLPAVRRGCGRQLPRGVCIDFMTLCLTVAWVAHRTAFTYSISCVALLSLIAHSAACPMAVIPDGGRRYIARAIVV